MQREPSLNNYTRTWGSRKQASSEFINAPTFCDLKSLYMASACALTALSLDIRHFNTSDIDIFAVSREIRKPFEN